LHFLAHCSSVPLQVLFEVLYIMDSKAFGISQQNAPTLVKSDLLVQILMPFLAVCVPLAEMSVNFITAKSECLTCRVRVCACHN
jgi:hypothetical protein